MTWSGAEVAVQICFQLDHTLKKLDELTLLLDGSQQNTKDGACTFPSSFLGQSYPVSLTSAQVTLSVHELFSAANHTPCNPFPLSPNWDKSNVYAFCSNCKAPPITPLCLDDSPTTCAEKAPKKLPHCKSKGTGTIQSVPLPLLYLSLFNKHQSLPLQLEL